MTLRATPGTWRWTVRGVLRGGERLLAEQRCHHRAGARRRGAAHRRAVRRVEGTDRRLQPDRVLRPRRGHRGGLQAPRRQVRDDRGEAALGGVRPDVRAAVAEAFREEWGRVVATLIRTTGDWDLAEECAQEAFARALETWPRDGVPRRPGAWRSHGPPPPADFPLSLPPSTPPPSSQPMHRPADGGRWGGRHNPVPKNFSARVSIRVLFVRRPIKGHRANERTSHAKDELSSGCAAAVGAFVASAAGTPLRRRDGRLQG